MTDQLFDGDTIDPDIDNERLNTQLGRVYQAMLPGEWMTLGLLARKADGSEAAVSARLRDLRKPWWGEHTIEKKRADDSSRLSGQWLYRMASNKPLLDGHRDEHPKKAARERVTAFLDAHDDWYGPGVGIISTGGQRLHPSDLRELLR